MPTMLLPLLLLLLPLLRSLFKPLAQASRAAGIALARFRAISQLHQQPLLPLGGPQ
jgi:hypothetical protein